MVINNFDQGTETLEFTKEKQLPWMLTHKHKPRKMTGFFKNFYHQLYN